MDKRTYSSLDSITPILFDESIVHRVVKLTKNYRSHDAILRYPNDRFYNGDLVPCGARSTVDSFIGCPLLVSKAFPIVFHAMSGKDDREASSPSFFNIEEVLQVKRYVERLHSPSAEGRFRVGSSSFVFHLRDAVVYDSFSL